MLVSKIRTIFAAVVLVSLLSACGDSEEISGGGIGGSNNSSVSGNVPPVVVIGGSQSFDELTLVSLDASGSSDSDGSIVSYLWFQLDNGAPEITLTNPESAVATFMAPDVIFDTEFEFRLIVVDDGGRSAALNTVVTVIGGLGKLNELAPVYETYPIQNESVTISLNVLEAIGDGTTWTVVSEPVGSAITLSESSDHKAVTFTPTVAGTYELLVQSPDTGTQKTIEFNVIPAELGFDQTKIKGSEGLSQSSVDRLLAIISNQSWVYSATLTQNEIETVIADYAELTVKGYDAVDGVLVEYDDTDIFALEALAELSLRVGIDSVANRVFEGPELGKDEAVTPDDGSAFDDGGDNWHLEAINMPDAWEYTTGSSDVLIGITDGGYDSLHPELKTRIVNQFTTDATAHGSAVAGAIAANTDNGTGMSGINWVSNIVLGDNQKDSLKYLALDSDVKVFNNAWAIPGLIPETFIYYSSTLVNDRNSDATIFSRAYRNLAESYEDRLLVWPAGNGIGNGDGNITGYGVYGRHHSSALHYDDNGNLHKRDNVMFVAAMLQDGRLDATSNYGAAVDIAAPSAFKSLDSDYAYTEVEEGGSYGTNDSSAGSFTGTSAATSVVSGVASLIYSLNPNFTGEQVKHILIESASTSVTERYKTPGPAGDANANIESLTKSIPVLDASAALAMAETLINNKVWATDIIPNPLVSQARVDYSTLVSGYEVVDVDWQLDSSADGQTGWALVSSGSIVGTSVLAALDTGKSYHRMTSTVTVRNTSDASLSDVTSVHNFSYANVTVTAKDTVSLAALSGVTLTPEQVGEDETLSSAITNGSGVLQFYVGPGSYKIHGTFTGYGDSAASFTSDGVSNLSFDYYMMPDSAVSVGVGSLSGYVRTVAGDPIVGAVVRVSGGAQTNGAFASAITDSTGRYAISNISKKDSSGSQIESFSVEASATNYFKGVADGVIVLAGKDRSVNVMLADQSAFGTVHFSDDMESGTNGWTSTGFWHQQDLSSSIANTLVPTYTSLAPDEAGPQALLPSATSGSSAWWYGEASTGTFIGTQAVGDSALSGGRSDSANDGALTSPSIDLTTGTTPILLFNTWWEIESVNPNSSGFDLLELQVSTDGGNSFTTIKKLNPYVDPNDSDRNHKPFSSGGFNRKPVWVIEDVDLTEYIGQTIQLRFNFDTKDALYNGFRGWIVDDVSIIDISQ